MEDKKSLPSLVVGLLNVVSAFTICKTHGFGVRGSNVCSLSLALRQLPLVPAPLNSRLVSTHDVTSGREGEEEKDPINDLRQ